MLISKRRLVSRARGDGVMPAAAPADARVPRPRRAEALLRRMAREGWPVSTEAGTLAVDICCRAGDLRRAEALATAMEAGGCPRAGGLPPAPVSIASVRVAGGGCVGGGDGGCAHPLAGFLPLPNEGTYVALRDGWQRAGLLHTVTEREGPYGTLVPGGAGAGPAVCGVPATRRPAPSELTSWARRRTGYMPIHSGCMHTLGGAVVDGSVSGGPMTSKSDGAEVLVKWLAR